MTERVKIKCDDCKFVDDCVDYGWEGCRKFTPAPSTPMTTEEWFCQLSTEEKAKWITENLSVYADSWVKSDEKLLNPATWVEWLKQPHTVKE